VSDLGEVWRSKSDDEIVAASLHLGDYTPEAREVIMCEMETRGLSVPNGEPSEKPDKKSPPVCAACGLPLALSVLGNSMVGICEACGAQTVLPIITDRDDERTANKTNLAKPKPSLSKVSRERYVKCPECGRPIADNSDFCYHCGAGIQNAHTLTAAEPPQGGPIGARMGDLSRMKWDKIRAGVEFEPDIVKSNYDLPVFQATFVDHPGPGQSVRVCIRCAAVFPLEPCPNCGYDGFVPGFTSAHTVGLFCYRCEKGFVRWKCPKCGTDNPISKSLAQRSGGCFIASAVYGSDSAPAVLTLRSFRDEHLATTSLGRWLVAVYYCISPSVAAWVSTRPWVRGALRCCLLDQIAKWIHSRNHCCDKRHGRGGRWLQHR
jgi:predicted RNA-binding Zn-ribbon protein involved in translation (DUF1610 family)